MEAVWESLGDLEAPAPSAPGLPSLREVFGDPFHGEASAALERGAEDVRKTAALRELRCRIAACKSRMAMLRARRSATALRRRRSAAEGLAALEAGVRVNTLSPESKRALQETVYAMAGVDGVNVQQAKGAPGRACAAGLPEGSWPAPLGDRRAANRVSAAKSRKRRRAWLHALQSRDTLRLALTRLCAVRA